MESFEPKKLALIRIWQIFIKYSDYDHPLTQDNIAEYLERDYGIIIERKAISRNISLLKEAGVDIESRRAGSYIEGREFEDSELKLLIDGVLCSKHINPKHSADLIEKLCGLPISISVPMSKIFILYMNGTKPKTRLCFSISKWWILQSKKVSSSSTITINMASTKNYTSPLFSVLLHIC